MEDEQSHAMVGQQEESAVVTTSCGIGEERSSEAMVTSSDLDRRWSHSSTISTGAHSGAESSLSSPRSPNPFIFRMPEASSLSRRSSVLIGMPDFSALVTTTISQLPPTSLTSLAAINPPWPLPSPSLLLPTRLFGGETSMRPMSSLLAPTGRYRCSYCEFSSEDRYLIQLHMIQLHADFVSVPLNTLLGVSLPTFTTGITHQPIQTLQSTELLSWFQPPIVSAQASSSSAFSSASRLPHSLRQDGPESSAGDSSTATPEDQVRCETCGKFLPKKKPLSSLLNHAKRHYLLKQFICIQCPYGSSEAAHVRNHMKLRHNVVDRDPLDVRNASLQDAWLKITSRCFPTMTAELTRFRFKRFRKRHRKRTGSEPCCSSQVSSTGQERSSNDDDDDSDSFSQPGTSAEGVAQKSASVDSFCQSSTSADAKSTDSST